MPSCKWPIGNPHHGIQNPRLSWISLQGQYFLWQLAHLSFPSHWQFLFSPVHRLTLKNAIFSLYRGMASFSTFQNMSHFIIYSCHFQHHRVYGELTMACSSVALMNRVLHLVIPKVKIQQSMSTWIFSGSFLNLLGCLFNCGRHFHFHNFLHCSK